MSYRGFTWNLTATEVANIARILTLHQQCPDARPWDCVIAKDLLIKCKIFLELTPDGTSPTHAHADA